MLKTPELAELVVAPPSPPADIKKQPWPWQRITVGTAFVCLGATAAAVGIASIGYRLTHIVVDGGLINGRIVRLQSAVDGNIKDFYAKPGALVKSGQVLARIDIEASPQEEQLRLQVERSQDDQIRSQLERAQLQGEVQAKVAQVVAARQSVVFLKNQLQNLEKQFNAVQGVDVAIAYEAVSQQQASIEAAVAKATAARSDYQRYKLLAAQGAVSQQQTEQLRSVWESAEAEVKQAKAALRSAQASLSAAKNGVALSNKNSLEGTLSDQRTKLLQEIQAQEVVASTLESEVKSGRLQLSKIDSLYKNRATLVSDRPTFKRDRQLQEVSAPLSGVVYSTEREQSEQVSRSADILTLLDCNDLWVETVIRADQASSIDTQKPVSVQMAGHAEPVNGEVDLIQPVSSIQGIEERTKLMQVQALLPAIPPNLVGQPLARVTVRIPPPPQHQQSQQFCGVGQASRVTFAKKL